MIAGEALFLDPSMKGEATYRLALHAGSFIEHPGHGRLAVFKFMRDAYGIRSDIVHGRDNVRYRLLNGGTGTFAAFTTDLEDVIRRSVRLAVASEPFPPIWEQSLLGDPPHQSA